jgi:hypothetical protein
MKNPSMMNKMLINQVCGDLGNIDILTNSIIKSLVGIVGPTIFANVRE